MKLSIGCDHGGFELKEQVKAYLEQKGYEIVDCGTNSKDSCNYPVFARAAAKLVASKECDLGIVICTSGEGVCMTANKVKGVRCGLAYNVDVARLIVEHNNANMISIGAAYTTFEEAKERIDTFLNAKFQGGRHELRVSLIEVE